MTHDFGNEHDTETGPLTRQSMTQAVRAAFAVAQPESTPRLVKADGDKGWKWRVEMACVEQRDDLVPSFLIAFASGTHKLSTASERWFWRSLLLAALQARWDLYDDSEHPEIHRLLFTTVYTLRANPCDVLKGRIDYEDYGDAPNLRERLTSAQRIAIARFLAAILQDPLFALKSMADMAAQAILWCWRDDPASIEAANAHHMGLRSYRRPTHESQTFESKILAIELAFADTPYPKGPLMGHSLDDESCVYELAFKGADWRQLTPRLISHNFPAFSFMTPETFRYFIPAVLCHELGPGSMIDTEIHLVDCLIEWSSRDRDYFHARVDIFSPDERWAIVEFLHFKRMCNYDMEPERAAAYAQAMDLWEPPNTGA
jgi:hypothetical protein